MDPLLLLLLLGRVSSVFSYRRVSKFLVRFPCRTDDDENDDLESCRVSHKKLSSRKLPSFPERKNTATTKTTITTTTRYYYSIPAHNIYPIHRNDRRHELPYYCLDPEETHTPNKQTNNRTNVLQTCEKTNPAVSQKPPERNPKSLNDTGEKKIIIIAVVVVAVMVM